MKWDCHCVVVFSACPWPVDRLVGLVVRRSPRERKIPGSNPACVGTFPGSSHTSDLKIWHSSGLPCQAPGVIGLVLGLVDPVSVYCDWVRWKVWCATSISLWQHVKLSEQVRPWDTLACCWDVKKATNKPWPVYVWRSAFPVAGAILTLPTPTPPPLPKLPLSPPPQTTATKQTDTCVMVLGVFPVSVRLSVIH